jgi:hypothetical protein
MRHKITLLAILSITTTICNGQITVEAANDSTVRKYHMGQYSYHEQFKGHKGYGAPLILTADGGSATFGDGDEGCMLVKLNKNGKEQWKRIIKSKGEEMESQSVVEDKFGNFYVFILVYDGEKFGYRGGCERAVFINKIGTIVWDKFIGSCTMINSPTVAYIKALDDGRINLRGQVVKVKPAEGKDPSYLFWDGWLDKTGKLTQKSGAVIDWKKEEWKKKFQPE